MIRIRRLVKSFQYAFRGLFKTFREEQNLQIQFFIALIVVVLGVIFGISKFMCPGRISSDSKRLAPNIKNMIGGI